MGVEVVNILLARDHATPHRDSVVRLHMDLPIESAAFAEINELLNANRWDVIEAKLVRTYPRHRDILALWLSACKQRSMHRTEPDPGLKAVNG